MCSSSEILYVRKFSEMTCHSTMNDEEKMSNTFTKSLYICLKYDELCSLRLLNILPSFSLFEFEHQSHTCSLHIDINCQPKTFNFFPSLILTQLWIILISRTVYYVCIKDESGVLLHVHSYKLTQHITSLFFPVMIVWSWENVNSAQHACGVKWGR